MKMKKEIVLLLSLSLLFYSLTSCVVTPKTPPETPPETPPAKYSIRLTEFEGTVEIHTPLQAAYLNDTPSSIAKYVSDLPLTDRSAPQEVKLSWSVISADEGETVPSLRYRVSISTFPDMSNAKTVNARDPEYSITNLLLGTTYFWKVSFVKDGETYESPIGSFTTTSKGPRNVYIDGVTNCRDLGGYTTLDGRKVKQGMMYRTAKLSKTTSVYITDAGMKTMKNELGIKAEIDLRSGTSEIRTESVLSGVKLFNIGCTGANMVKLEPILPDLFDALADESNYPLFFHCAIGTDRTGALAYLILGLLGVSDEDIYRDYCFSNFGNIFDKDSTSADIRIINNLYEDDDPEVVRVGAAVNAASGTTRQEKVRNYLKSLGITDATLDSVVRLMLE